MLMEIPPGQGWINLALSIDLIFLSNMLIWKIWVLASPMIMSMSLLKAGIIACFLEGSFVVDCIFCLLLSSLENATL